MNVHRKRLFHDAAGYTFEPCGVIYTSTDVIGWFSDAVARGDPPNAEIVGYYSEQVELGVCAFIRNRNTKMITLYGMDCQTGKPFPIFSAPGEPPRRPRKRPRFSREWKLMEAERRWKER